MDFETLIRSPAMGDSMQLLGGDAVQSQSQRRSLQRTPARQQERGPSESFPMAPSALQIQHGAIEEVAGAAAVAQVESVGGGLRGHGGMQAAGGGGDSVQAMPSARNLPARRLLLGKPPHSHSKIFMPSRLRSVKLSLLSEEELLRGSVVHVFNPDKPYASVSSMPIPNAINDTRMGVMEHGLVCATCGGDAKTCPGHFGHMMLNIAIFHPAYIRLAMSVLKCVCWTCAALLNPNIVPPDESTLERLYSPKDIRRLKWLSKRRPPHACPRCSMPQPNYSKLKATSTRIIWSWNPKRISDAIPPEVMYEMRKPFTAARARMIFEAMDESTIRYLGLLGHPKDFVLRAVPVPPPCVRPSVVKIEGSKMRGQDDLTSILMNICKRISHMRTSSFDERSTPRLMYEFGLILDECTSADLKRVSKVMSKAGRKEELRIIKERRQEEVKAKRAVGSRDRRAVLQSGAGGDPGNPPLSAAAFSLSVMPDAIPNLSFPFDENRVDSLIAMTRPHTTPATARLNARPDLRLCEYLQTKNSKLLTLMELVLSIHLNTDGKDTSIMRQRSGAQKKTIIKRLKAKEGRMRGNIMGKRVFGSGRAVISPCQSLDVDELGVPQSMASVLTYGKVLVNEDTIGQLRKCVRIGALRVNGANMVIKAATATQPSTRIYLEYAIDLERIAAELVHGDMVERYIQDGDLVIFNRQPSLHRVSMMAHRVRIMDSSTLRFNSAAAKPYNADFDGDEMNIHVPKGIHAQAEAKELLSITRNMISPATNALTLGIVQDGIVAAYLFTRPTTTLTRAQLHRLLSVVKYTQPGEKAESAGVTTGREALSMLLPPWLEIGGLCTKGVINPSHGVPALTKKFMGGSSNGITHRLCVDGSLEMGMHFLSDAQRMLHAWMAEAGFTTGLHDLVMAKHVRDRVRAILTDVLDVVDVCNEVMFECCANATRFVQHETEQRARALIANVVEEATQIGIRYLENEHDSGGKLTRNGLWDMIASGSKGSTANAFQMVIAVGTQIIGGQRIPIDPLTKRTLSCFAHGRNDATSRGLCRRSYVDGLRPYEFFMHNMGGREGIVHTAIKTAETGYLQRRLIKAMEDLVGMADGSVRDGELRVVQYLYGGDGLDPTRIQLTPAPFYNLSIEELRAQSSAPGFVEAFVGVRALLRKRYTAPGGASPGSPPPNFLLPCDPERVLRRAMRDVPHSRMYAARFDGSFASIVDYFKVHLPLALFLVWTLRDCRDPDELVRVSATCAAMYDRARMAAGETCGIISAQSIGEPSTQMTLNSPHHSGRVGSRVTMGVPRLREIIDRRKAGAMETPLMIIPVLANTQEMAEKVMRMVRRIRIRDVLHSSFVALDPALPAPHPPSNMPKDVEWIEDVVLANFNRRESDVVSQPGTGSQVLLSPYVIRFSLRRDVMLEMGIAPYTMARAIEKVLSQTSQGGLILHSPRTAKNWIVRVRVARNLSENSTTPAATPAAMPTDSDWYHETQQVHVQILRKACANQAHIVDWATAGKAEYTELDSQTDQLRQVDQWVIQASGSSLASMSRIKELDWTRAHTNDIAMTNAVLGLEAANALYYEQMLSVLNNDGSYIDPRHVQMFADAVTYYGYPMPARRHGVLRKKTGWAHRASFEEMVSVLMTGAVREEVDNLVAPAGAVMTGQMGAFGSGWVGILDESSDKYRTLTNRLESAEENAPFDARVSHINAATGTLMTRPVDVLRRIHNRLKLARTAAGNGNGNGNGNAPPPTPVVVKPPLHKYTVGGAIAATTYEGYAEVDYMKDSRPVFEDQWHHRTFGRKVNSKGTAAHHEVLLSMQGLDITVLGKMGQLRVVKMGQLLSDKKQ